MQMPYLDGYSLCAAPLLDETEDMNVDVVMNVDEDTSLPAPIPAAPPPRRTYMVRCNCWRVLFHPRAEKYFVTQISTRRSMSGVTTGRHIRQEMMRWTASHTSESITFYGARSFS